MYHGYRPREDAQALARLRVDKFFLALPNIYIIIVTYSRRSAIYTFTAIIEKCTDTNLYVGHIPGFPEAHSQGETIEELNRNLKEVIEMILEDGVPIEVFLKSR